MWTPFFSSALIAFALTPLVRRLAWSLGFVDRPSGRKLHREQTPLLGGLAIFVAVWAAAAWAGGVLDGRGGVALFIALALLTAVGLVDDRRALPVRVKLVAQIGATALLLASGFVLATPLPQWADLLLSGLWIVGLTNAFNLLDNMDGAAAGVACVSALALSVVGGMLGVPLALVLGPALAGAALGFLPYNFPPARLFMGDSGSFFLGSTLAVLGIAVHNAAEGLLVAPLLPLLALAVPIFDTSLVCLSRLRRGLNPLLHPGKDHLAHRLLARGWSARGAAMGLYGAALACGALAFLVPRLDPAILGIAVAAGGVMGLVLLWWFERQSSLPVSGEAAPAEAAADAPGS